MKELQEMIDRWKKAAARLEACNEEKVFDECFYFQYKGEIAQLRKCASEAEFLLFANKIESTMIDETAVPFPPAEVVNDPVLDNLYDEVAKSENK